MTRDARLLGLNIGSPDGRISDTLPRNPAEFGGPGSGHAGRRLTLNGGHNAHHHHQQHNIHAGGPNGQHQPNGFGIPNVNAKGRFVHPAQPSTQAFAAATAQQQQQQGQDQQKQQQIEALAGSDNADAQAKIQRLISETRNLPSSFPPPAAPNGSQRAHQPRPNGPLSTSQALGRRPPPQGATPRGPHAAASVHANAHSQRVPSGENDFPALSASAGPASPANGTAAGARTSSMERSTSATSGEKKDDFRLAASAPSASAEVKKEEAPAAPAQGEAQASTTPAPAPAASSAPATAAPAAAAAPAKPAFSWASAAAKAASLPTPPPKRPVSKARPAAKDGKESKAAKAEKGDKKEKEKEKERESQKETAPAPAAKTAASVVAAAASAAPVAAEPASVAAQTIAAESPAAPALKA